MMKGLGFESYVCQWYDYLIVFSYDMLEHDK